MTPELSATFLRKPLWPFRWKLMSLHRLPCHHGLQLYLGWLWLHVSADPSNHHVLIWVISLPFTGWQHWLWEREAGTFLCAFDFTVASVSCPFMQLVLFALLFKPRMPAGVLCTRSPGETLLHTSVEITIHLRTWELKTFQKNRAHTLFTLEMTLAGSVSSP